MLNPLIKKVVVKDPVLLQLSIMNVTRLEKTSEKMHLIITTVCVFFKGKGHYCFKRPDVPRVRFGNCRSIRRELWWGGVRLHQQRGFVVDT